VIICLERVDAKGTLNGCVCVVVGNNTDVNAFMPLPIQ